MLLITTTLHTQTNTHLFAKAIKICLFDIMEINGNSIKTHVRKTSSSSFVFNDWAKFEKFDFE
jgi:hypothetical protein